MNHYFNRASCFIWILLFCLSCISNQCYSQRKIKDLDKQGRKQDRSGRGTNNKSIARIDIHELTGNLVLGCPTDQSITANVILTKDMEAFIEYSSVSKTYPNRTAVKKSSDGEPIEIVIDHLTANTIYYYRLNYRNQKESIYKKTTESFFSTQKSKGSTFSFSVQGDSHPEREGKMFNPALYHQTVDSIYNRKPDFCFMMGDDFGIDKQIAANKISTASVANVFLNQRSYIGNMGKNTPVFLVNGNHEAAAKYLLDGTANSPAVLAATTRNKYFPLPSPSTFYSGDQENIEHIGLLKDYYAFEWGDALFIVIDPYWHSDVAVDNDATRQDNGKRKDLWTITLGNEQYQWFKNMLETSKAKYKFVFSHHVSGTGRGGVERAKLFEWGGYSQNGSWDFKRNRPTWEMPIHQLMVKNHVTIFFQGHDHLFAKQELDGVIYQEVPVPADDTYSLFNDDAYTSGVKLPNSGFLNVTASPKAVTVEYIRSFLNNVKPPLTANTTNFSYTLN